MGFGVGESTQNRPLPLSLYNASSEREMRVGESFTPSPPPGSLVSLPLACLAVRLFGGREEEGFLLPFLGLFPPPSLLVFPSLLFQGRSHGRREGDCFCSGLF